MLLGSIRRSQGWQMQHGACYEIRRARQDTVPRSVGGSLANPCIPTDCLMDRLPLGRQRRCFSPNSSVSSSIKHRRVILYLHSFTFHFTAVL